MTLLNRTALDGGPAAGRPDHGSDHPVVTERDDQAKPLRLEGGGVDHRVVERRSEADVTVSDQAGQTSVRVDEDRTTITRVVDGHRSVLERSLAGRTTEQWRIPGTPHPIALRRDHKGIIEVEAGATAIGRRAEVDGAVVLRWDGGLRAGESGDGPVVGNGREQRCWPVDDHDDGSLTVGPRHHRFDRSGRLAGLELTDRGSVARTWDYHYIGTDLLSIDTPEGRVDLTVGAGGRVRSRRVGADLVTYGYDTGGRRQQETGPQRRRLRWDGLGRLLAVSPAAERDGGAEGGATGGTGPRPDPDVTYDHDAFGRRVARHQEGVVEFEHRDLQGRLWSVTSADGRALHTWLWDGHRCLARWDGPVDGPPSAVYATVPSGSVVGTATADTILDSPWGPFGERLGRPRTDDHLVPAVHFHFADRTTGYVHLIQREYDPATWSFLGPDPNRGDDNDLRRRLLGATGQLSVDPSTPAPGYALCGHDPIRRLDANGAVSAGTVVWQIFGGLTWHLPAHIINFLWIHPFVNFNFATILAWLPAIGVDRGGFESWHEFWLPRNYSHEESTRQDIAGFLMAGWMSSNRTFTFQNAIWGRKVVWDQLDTTAGFEPTDEFAQLRHGSIVRIHRDPAGSAATFDDWTLAFAGFDGVAFAGARQFSVGGGTGSAGIIGDGRDRVLTEGNLHLFRDVDDIDAAGDETSLVGDNPDQPGHGLVEFHERVTTASELAPGATCTTVTVRNAGRLFTHQVARPATADGDVILLGPALAVVDGVGARDGSAELSVRPASGLETLPPTGPQVAIWTVADAVSEALSAGPGGLALTTTNVPWAAGDLARFGGPGAPTVRTTAVVSRVPVLAQDALTAGLDVRPLTNPQPIGGVTIDGNDLRVPGPTGPVDTITTGLSLRLTDGATVAIGRVTAVTPDGSDQLVTLHQTPAALGFAGNGPIGCDRLTVAATRGTVITPVAVGAGTLTIAIATNTAQPATTAGFTVGGTNALAVVTGPEARTIAVDTTQAPGAAPWNITRLTIPTPADQRVGSLSDNVEMVAAVGGDPLTAIPADAALRLRSVTVPGAGPAPVPANRLSDTTFEHPGGVDIGAGDLVQVVAGTSSIVSVEDVALSVTLDRPVGAVGDVVDRVCTLQQGEADYTGVLDATPAVRLDGNVQPPIPAPPTPPPPPIPGPLPSWQAGDVIRITDGANTEEFLLDADYTGGALALRGGLGPLPSTLNPGPIRVRRMRPAWPPLALPTTRPGAGSSTVEAGPGAAGLTHRWIVARSSRPAAGQAVVIQIGDAVAVARIAAPGSFTVRSSTLPAGAITDVIPITTAAATDRVSVRWRPVGDEIRLLDTLGPTPGGGAVMVLDSLASAQSVAVRPRRQAVACPAEPENPDWIFTAYEALREHELHHTIQSSRWGPLMLGLPLTVLGDLVWDLRGGSGSIEAGPWVPVERRQLEGPPDRQVEVFVATQANPAGFSPEPGTVIELDGGGVVWRSVALAVDAVDDQPRFMLHNPPEDDFGGDGGIQARVVSHNTPEADGWLATFRFLDTFSNARIMEFTTGLIWEGLIHLFWMLGRGLASTGIDRMVIERTSNTSGDEVRAVDREELAELGLEVGSRVIIDTEQGGNDDYPTVVTGILDDVVSLRDPLPNYPAESTLRLMAYQSTDPDRWRDVWSYTPARLIVGAGNTIQLTGDEPPTLSIMDIVRVKWVEPDGTNADVELRVTMVVDPDQHLYQLQRPIEGRIHDPDVLQVAKLGSADDPNDFGGNPGDNWYEQATSGVSWFLNRSYETPIRLRRVTRYLFDPWRALTGDTDFVEPDDGATWKKVLAWITRSARYAFSNRSWTPFFGKVWWTSVFGNDHASDLEQQASWESGDLYTTITRSGDPRVAGSEGSFGQDPGNYLIFEGELLRMWTWESWRWNDVFTNVGAPINPLYRFNRQTNSPQNPSLRNGTNDVTPWTMTLSVTPTNPPAGPGLSTDLYQGPAAGPLVPRPLLTIPTRADVARNQGFYFVAGEAGPYVITSTSPMTGVRENEAEAAGVQNFRRTVDVQPLTIQAGGTNLPWQVVGDAPALTLFPTQAVDITVAGTGGDYEVRVTDDTLLARPDDLRLQARVTAGTALVEVVRVYESDDPYLTQFGTYLAGTIRVPVRATVVSIDPTIVIRSGPTAADPPLAGPARPGDTVSVLLPVAADAPPVPTWVGAPVGPPSLPTVAGPVAVDALLRYDITIDSEPPEDAGQLDLTFSFTDPVDPTVNLAVTGRMTIEPRATLQGPPFEVSVAAGSVDLAIAPNDGSAVDPASVIVDPADAAPGPGLTVVPNGAGITVTADPAAVVGATFVARVVWDGTPVRRTVTVVA